MAFCTAAVDPTAQHCEAIYGLSCRLQLFAAVQVRKSFRIAFIEGDIMSVGFSKDQCTHIVRARPNMLTDVTQTMKKEELRAIFTNDIVEVPICMHARVHATAAVDGVRHPQPAGRAGGRQIAPLPKPAHTRPCVATMAVRAQVKNFVEGGQRAGDPKKQISSTILFESRDFEEYTFHGRRTDLIFATKVCTHSVCARVRARARDTLLRAATAAAAAAGVALAAGAAARYRRPSVPLLRRCGWRHAQGLRARACAWRRSSARSWSCATV
eukprot:COSAG01_NODE_1170_length_11406_cov_17.917662_10_plen_269_part_00